MARVSPGSSAKIAEALAGAHLSGAQDQMVRVELADGVAILGEVKFNGSRRELGFESVDLGLADSAEFLQGQSASVAVGGKIG
jgi:hypothetical protein